MLAGLGEVRIAPGKARPRVEAAVLPNVADIAGVVFRLGDEGRELIDGELEFAEREGLAIVTRRCGPSLSSRSRSVSGEPMRKSPAGMTTISGHRSQSRNVSPALGACANAGAHNATSKMPANAARIVHSPNGLRGIYRAAGAKFQPVSSVGARVRAAVALVGHALELRPRHAGWYDNRRPARRRRPAPARTATTRSPTGPRPRRKAQALWSFANPCGRTSQGHPSRSRLPGKPPYSASGGGRNTISCLAESATTSGGFCSFMPWIAQNRS